MTHWRARHSVLPNSRPQEREPFIHPFEIGSNLLFLFVILAPLALVGGACIGYAAFIAQPAEYQVGSKANR